MSNQPPINTIIKNTPLNKGFYYDKYTELETFALYKDSFLLLHSVVHFDILENNEIEILNYIKDCISKDKNDRNEIVFEFRS